MTVAQFLLVMCFTRILLMVISIYWLKDPKLNCEMVRRNMSFVCLYMLLSNLLNVVLVVGILKVVLW